MGRIVSQYYKIAENISHIPFIDPVTVITCDYYGIHHTLTGHGITMDIPEGVIPKGQVISIELAVALYGPFIFPNNTRPISPILWICPQEHIEFSLPIQVILPHFLTGHDQQKLAHLGVEFAKSNHNSCFNESHNAVFSFQTCSVKPRFSTKGKQAFGSLETRHCCFLCLTAKPLQCPELARGAGFCFSRIDYMSKSSTYVVVFCVSFFLQSCLKVNCIDSMHST